MIENLQIGSPKRGVKQRTGWEGFFPYYAGYPEDFARDIIISSRLPPSAEILDPWNGSGTTTYAATKLGFSSFGLDINPVMVIVARARLLAPSEADSLTPLALAILSKSKNIKISSVERDPLLSWFSIKTTKYIRSIEISIRKMLMGGLGTISSGARFDKISSIAAAFFVNLFTTCRELAVSFRSTNPTWFRYPKTEESRIDCSRRGLIERFLKNVQAMETTLAAESETRPTSPQPVWNVALADTTIAWPLNRSFDLILTSPPYCTRIDYTAATRVELAIISPLSNICVPELSRRMIGSTKVPNEKIEPLVQWGPACNEFLEKISLHQSKASSTYYYKTHVDYFRKMHSAMNQINEHLKSDGCAVMVVQDSYYKDIHNDLPTIIGQMGDGMGLKLLRREDFYAGKSMSLINPRSRLYNRKPGAIEAVMCFRKG